MKKNIYIWECWDILKQIQDCRSFFIKEAGRDSKLTVRQMRVLVQVGQEGKTSLLQLSRNLEMNPGNLSRLLTELQEKSFIKRTRDRFDNRKVWLTLTAKGKLVIEQFEHRLENNLSQYLDSKDQENLDLVRDALADFADFLVKQRQRYLQESDHF